ncbi:MAG: hypothetical protein RMJ38_06630 [candidate division WOR-3 bacterium]|nr:hypothetical protein [candidate division WOR-3 bacterium]MDW8151097.1 hypothetical protein [candidate division WOR-3 bacterium]
MMCDDIITILNEAIFSKDKYELLRRIVDNPERFTGLLRPTKPYGKVIQFLLQSHEIKFGGALQKVIGHAIEQLGYNVEMEKEYELNNEPLVIDMIISRDRTIIVEMKIRDDHDSTKKRGQISNFEKKIEAFIRHSPETKVESVLYFVDPTIRKNEAFYRRAFVNISNFYNIDVHLLYGEELFKFLGHTDVWHSIVECLKLWKKTIPDLPNVDYDSDINDSVNILRGLSLADWRKLIENDELWEEDGIISRLFKNGDSLRVTCQMFENHGQGRLSEQYKKIAKGLKMRLEKLYGKVKNESN